jgi:hypothetical protein
MSKKMSECIDILEDMVKSLTFDPLKPVEMNNSSPYYNPYQLVDGNGGGYSPHPSNYWKKQGARYDTVDYRANDEYHSKYMTIHTPRNIRKSEETKDALDFLIKGGPGSGPPVGRHGRDPHAHLSPAAIASKKLDAKLKEKPKKENEAEDKEKHAKDVARLVSYMKSEDKMSKEENDLFKSLGITVGNIEDVNLIQSVEENQDVIKSIENNDFHIGSKKDINKAYGDENLKNTHGEKAHKDNDKKVEKLVTKIDEVKYPKEGETPKSRALDSESQKSLSDTIDDLIKGDKKEKKAKEKLAEGVDDLVDAEVKEHEVDMHKKSTADLLNDLIKAEAPDMTSKEDKAIEAGDEPPEPEAQLSEDGDEMDEAEVEAAKEITDNQQVGTDTDKSENVLFDLAKACDKEMTAAMDDYKAGDLDELQKKAHKDAKKKNDLKDMHENSEEK